MGDRGESSYPNHLVLADDLVSHLLSAEKNDHLVVLWSAHLRFSPYFDCLRRLVGSLEFAESAAVKSLMDSASARSKRSLLVIWERSVTTLVPPWSS